MSITTKKLEMFLVDAITEIEMRCLRSVRFYLNQLNETGTLYNLLIGPFPSYNTIPILTIDLEDPRFQEVKSSDEMQKLVFIKLAEVATSISIEKNIDNTISAPLFNIEEISGVTYGHVKDFITEFIDQQQYLDKFFGTITLTLRFQIIQPTYNTEGMGSHTYIEKINPIAETLTLSLKPTVMV